MIQMDKIAIVVKGGMVQEVYGTSSLYQTDIAIIDLDLDGAAPEVEQDTLGRLQTVGQHLCKLY